MRILSVLTQKPFGTGSGAYLTGLIHALAEAGHEQAVVGGICAGETMTFVNVSNVRTYPVYYESEEVPFPVVGMSDQMPYRSTLYRDLDPVKETQLYSAFQRVLHKAVEEFQPDLIICHHLYLLTSWVRDWFPSHKVYGVCHGSDLRQYGMTDKWRDNISDSIRRLDRVYALHEVQKEQIEKLHGCRNVRILGSAINQDIFCPIPQNGESSDVLREDLQAVSENVKVLLYVGKLSRSKGVLSLLRAVKMLPYRPEELEIWMAGGPGNEEEMRQIYTAAEDCLFRVRFLGLVRPMELAGIYHRADCFVLPSFYEGLPLVIFEARACLTSVVCTDLPGVKNWADANVPGHAISFVAMPEMIGADEPDPKALPLFEKSLADVLHEKLKTDRTQEPVADLSELTWRAVAARLTN